MCPVMLPHKPQKGDSAQIDSQIKQKRIKEREIRFRHKCRQQIKRLSKTMPVERSDQIISHPKL